MHRLFLPLALAVAFGLAAWLRLDQLASQVLIEDEWHPVHQVIYLSPLRILTSFGNADYGIPLVLLYFLQARLVGLSELGLRLPMVAAGLATVAFLPLMLRRRLDDRVLATFALLLALSPFLVSYSRIARSYAITLVGIYAAFWCLERATREGAFAWRHAWRYSVLSGLVVWTHAVTGPMLVAPLAALWWGAMRGRGPAWRTLVALTALTAACMGLAVVPPLFGDLQALAGKSGIDQIKPETIVGAWYLWVGTGSSVIALTSLALAVVGFAAVWRASPVARWIVLGALFTVAVLVMTKPWWVDRSLALGRYLLPALPVVLLAISAGLIASADAATGFIATQRRVHPAWALAVVAIAVLAWWPQSPHGELLQRPNSYTQHSFFQYDYRVEKNPIRIGQLTYPASGFWATLASSPPGSLTIAVAPFQYATWEWPAPLWERASGQRVIPAYLWGTCEARRYGEVPPDGRFHFDNAVYVANGWPLAARPVHYLAFYRGPARKGMSPPLPQCEAWMRLRFGQPFHEDEALVVWKNPSPVPAAPD
ncbi:MAG TPA: glycosyltransferase family 39 protein [Usitatibacteraceae bacterium]|nr:glycosyltransferase family 39 protein [Usitatibacteraceae bacterium]